MSSERAQRRALERKQRKHSNQAAVDHSMQAIGYAPLWLALLVALPAVVVPLYFVYMLPGTLVEGSSGLAIINEFQKYVAELVCFGLLLACAGVWLVRNNLWPRVPGVILWPALLFLASFLSSLFQAQDLERGVVNSLQSGLLPLLFFLLIASLRWTQLRILSVLGLMSGAGLVVGLIGICQGLEIWPFALSLPHVGAGSLVFFQNLAGEYLIVLIPPAVALIFVRIHWLFRACAAICSSILLVHLVMTLARGAWVGLFCGVAVTFVFAALGFYWIKRSGVGVDENEITTPVFASFTKRNVAVSGVVLLALLLAVGLWVGSVGKDSDSTYVKELLSINLDNTTGRLQIWTDSLGLLEDSWLFGVGAGHYRVAFPPYLEASPEVPYLFQWDEKTGRIMYPFRPHNDYLQNWIELGIFGLIGMVWLFVAILWISARGIGDSMAAGERQRALLILGCLGAFSAWAMSMLFEFPFRMPASMVLGWMCAGFAVSLSWRTDEIRWSSIRPAGNWLASCVVTLSVLACFYVAHMQFWADIYENQAMVAWNGKKLTQGYEWQQRAYGYAPWKESNGATKARMELGLKKYQESLATSRQVLERNPYLLPALWTQGTAARMIGHGDESRAAFSKIVEVYPFLPENEKYRRFAGLPPVGK